MLTIRCGLGTKFSKIHKFSNILPSGSRAASSRSKYFEELKCEENLKQFPDNVLRTTMEKNPNLYVAIDSEAVKIADAIKSKRKENVPLVEVHPGPGILTKYLKNLNAKPLLLYEDNAYFVDILKQSTMLQSDPNMKLYKQPASSLWIYSHAETFIKPLPKRKWDEEVIGQAFITTSSISAIQNLCRNVILQNGVFQNGRIEFFVALPAADYVKLTCGPDSQYRIYLARSVIFQILFEHEFLLKIDRRAFLPWQVVGHAKKKSILDESIESDYIYLTRMVPRRDLLTYCDETDLMALSYFVCQCFAKRTSLIIPKLEKWIKGCGLPLICNTSPPKPSQPLDPSVHFHNLPKYCRPSMELSLDDYFPSIHTFTESGELTPEQMFTLFHWFKRLPGYETCEFLEYMRDRFSKKIVPDQEQNKSKRNVRKI